MERFPGQSCPGLAVGVAKSQFWNVCRYIQSPFQGRDLEGVLGGVCEAVAKQLYTVAVFSE